MGQACSAVMSSITFIGGNEYASRTHVMYLIDPGPVVILC